MVKNLNSLLIAALNEAHIIIFRLEHAGKAQVTTLQMITHVCVACTRIMANALKENDMRLDQAHRSLLPFESLVDQIGDTIYFALARK